MGLIAASILAADFARLGEEVAHVMEDGADWIHFDVMDNHYVPNLTIGSDVCKAIRPYAKKEGHKAFVDVHLMVEPVDDLALSFAVAGADLISFHPEASRHVSRTLKLIKDAGCKAGLVLNPATPLSCLDYVLHDVDLVLLMSVNPGFGGQSFIPQTLQKIKDTKAILDRYKTQSGRFVHLQVDGGIKLNNLAQIAQAGADVFVMGSGIFGCKDDHRYKTILHKLRDLLS